jgi:GDP-4-dehydro-6-deoxy-D-mannose reductase
MRVLVTGATGFAGRHLVALLRARRHQVTGTFRTPGKAGSLSGSQTECCDLRDFTAVRRVLEQAQPERIYHLGAFTSVRQSLEDPRAVYEVNFWGTFNLLQAVREVAAASRVLIVGSGQSYGSVRPGELPIRETQAFAPEGPYAASKAAADALAYQFFRSFGLKVVRARAFNHTGPGQSAEFVCSDFARQVAAIALRQRPPKVEVGDLSRERDFSDVRDVVRAYCLLLEKGRPGEAYNVSSGRSTPASAILRQLISFCPHPVHRIVRRERFRTSDPKRLYGDVRKLRRATGWAADYELATTLRDLYECWVTTLRSNSQ